MKQEFIRKENNDRLFLLFGGWGSWPGLFAENTFPEGYDVMVCYDYRSMDFDYDIPGRYRSVRLAAWSMGVWAASAVFSACMPEGALFPEWESRIAVNGTMSPIDDMKGIPVEIFRGTMEGMSAPVLTRFVRRMCGKELGYYLSRSPERSPEELKEELYRIWDAVHSPVSGEIAFKWDKAVIGLGDLIFPVAAQRNAWAGTETEERACAHYCRTLFDF